MSVAFRDRDGKPCDEGGARLKFPEFPMARVVVRRRGLIAWFRAWLRLCRHTECRIHETIDGIGGRCTACGEIFGWMTRAELDAISTIGRRFMCSGCESAAHEGRPFDPCSLCED